MALHSVLARRLTFGSLMVAILAGLLFAEGHFAPGGYGLDAPRCAGGLFVLAAAVFAAAGAAELARLAGASVRASAPIMAIAAAAVAGIPLLVQVSPHHVPPAILMGLVLMAALFAAALAQALRHGNAGTMAHLGLLCFSTVYLGLGMAFVAAIRLLGSDASGFWGQSGASVVFLTAVKSADIGAYLVGSRIGRHRWVPSISPNKTWEGFLGGIVLSMIVSSIFSGISGIMSLTQAVGFGVVVAVTGQLGDLLESMVKRDAGSKDSASVIPEFGGMLDLLDSVVVAAPFAWAYLHLLT